MKSNPLLEIIKTALNEKQAEEIEIVDVSLITPLAEYYVIASANNIRKMSAIVDEVERKILQAGSRIHHIEGKVESGWILIDAFNIIVHIFSPEERIRINLSDLISRPRRH